MQLSIVITTKDRKEKLLECIASIKRADFSDIQWELIVVDDNSTDGTEKLSAYDLQLENSKIIHNNPLQMMVRSRNIGAKQAQGKYIVFIDDDNVVDEKMFKALFEFAEKNKNYGIVGPTMYWWHDKKKYLNFQEIDFFTSRTFGKMSDIEKRVFDSDGVPNVFLVKKEVFEKTGYFDEALRNDYTEPDFAFNARKFGYACGMIPDAITYHNIAQNDLHGARTLAGQFGEKAYYLMRNRIIIIVRYGAWYHKLIFMLVFSWLWPSVYSLLMIKAGQFGFIKVYWKGFWDGWKYFFTRKIA